MVNKSTKNYADSLYGMIQRQRLNLARDVATVGTLVYSTTGESAVAFNLPVKAQLVKFGIIAAADIDVICSTTTEFELRTQNGTKIATFIPGSFVLGSWDATGVAPETATSLTANHGYLVAVGTDPGVSGSIDFFIDYREHFV